MGIFRFDVHRILSQGGGVQGQLRLFQQPGQPIRGHLKDRQTEASPHGGPNDFGPIGVRASVDQQQAVRSQGVRGPPDGAYVTRVLNAVQNQIPPPLQLLWRVRRRQGGQKQRALGRRHWRDALHHISRHLHRPDLLGQIRGLYPVGEHCRSQGRAPPQCLLQQFDPVSQIFSLRLPFPPPARG